MYDKTNIKRKIVRKRISIKFHDKYKYDYKNFIRYLC